MKIKTVIVDDVLLARERIKRYLATEPNIELAGECANGREAVEMIPAVKPDLIFLDVQMPELDGFGVLEEIGAAEMPVVIFVTAFDQFALRAFEVHALDYLLKPFSRERFREAMAHARAHIEREGTRDFNLRLGALLKDVKSEPKHLKRLAIRSSGRVLYLLTDEIDWIESAGNYVSVRAGKQSHLLRERMGQLELKLNPAKFVRIHRSTLVNIDRIKELHPLFNGDQKVILRDGSELTLSRNYRDRLLELLEKP
ncbi:MAG TPA: LytTR family DNA-binding domain-containing protein [Blastocatellia bacterium]|nr:LytTR family DNA-binding domain-containing protein [Blastocatellia bacterium]